MENDIFPSFILVFIPSFHFILHFFFLTKSALLSETTSLKKRQGNKDKKHHCKRCSEQRKTEKGLGEPFGVEKLSTQGFQTLLPQSKGIDKAGTELQSRPEAVLGALGCHHLSYV